MPYYPDIQAEAYNPRYVPRPDPLPIPAAAWNDEPTYCLQVNDEWVSHILGVMDALDQPDTWQGTEAEIDAARAQVNEIMAALMERCETVPPTAAYIVGEIRYFAAESAVPDGWVLCVGQELSRTTYADLFAVTDILYGEGNGVDTFRAPNLQGKVPVGSTGGSPYYAGLSGGEASHTLTVDEMPNHRHTVPVHAANTAGGGSSGVEIAGGTTNSGYIGGDQPHNNMQPYLVLVPAIYTGVLSG